MPMSFAALPHSTGKTVASAIPAAQRVDELLHVDRLVGEVALHEVVVGDHDPLDDRVVDRVLVVDELRRGSVPRIRSWHRTARR